MALNGADKDQMVQLINGILSQVPSFLRGSIGAKNLPGYLNSIPANFRGYTLQELIDAMIQANQENKFKW